MPQSPFLVFSWRRPFLPDLKKYLEKEGDPAQALIIFPNSRPIRYLTDLYAREKKNRVLPKMLAFSEIINIWRSNSRMACSRLANDLDQTALLHQCVLKAAQDHPALDARLAKMGMEEFAPWGLRLARLLEEMFIKGIEPKDMEYVENPEATAGALLGALGRISGEWRKTLAENDLSTPGLEARLAASEAENIPPLLSPESRSMYIAGFARLSGIENDLLQSLWSNGARVCLHTDPEILAGGQHWSCDIHASWAKNWGASLEPVPFPEKRGEKGRICFFAAYDLHSQLEEMKRELEDKSKAHMFTALALASPDSLLPVLHHLPDMDVNISIGYPVARGPLADLLEAILLIMANSPHPGRIYWRDLRKLVRHPYLNMLEAGDGNRTLLRKPLRLVDKALRNGEKFVNPEKLINELALQPDEDKFLRECLDVMLYKGGIPETMFQLAEMLENFANFLIVHGKIIWSRFPLDAEAMHRLLNNITPLFRDNLMAREKLSINSLAWLLKRYLEAERVPFEAEPITGLQILGLGETRLLNFDRVIVVDCTDDLLPGSPPQDPLLPDSLASLIGLPDARTREKDEAHNLFRLCAGAKETHFLWQEGSSRSNLFDGKKSRSRFVEQLVWNEEQRRGELLKHGSEPLRAASPSISVFRTEGKKLKRSPTLDAALKSVLASISASRLENYLKCPMAFALKNLLHINRPVEVNEGEDSGLVGSCVHSALKDAFSPWLEQMLHPGDIGLDDLMACFKNSKEKYNLRNRLPVEAYLMLETVAPIHFRAFLEAQEESVRIVGLEEHREKDVELCGKTRAFNGIIDRMEERGGSLHVLDYKTGKPKKFNDDLWGDEDFFAVLESFCLGAPLDDDAEACFMRLREDLPGLQLPVYALLAGEEEPLKLGGAAYVDLYSSGKEYGRINFQDSAKTLERVKLVLAFILEHMERSEEFARMAGNHCSYCDYSGICKL